MKRKVIVISFVLVAIFLILYGIIWYFSPSTSFWQTYKGPFYYKKMNKNEKNIIDSLNKKGFDSTEVYKPIIGLHGPDGSNVYNVFLKQLKILPKKQLKTAEFKVLAVKLYKNVISDFFIEDMEYISIQYNYCFKAKNKKYCDEKYYTFYKDSLESWCGFKVVKVGENKFKRVYTK